MSLFIVIGIGPNNLEIPLVPFGTQEEADIFVAQFPKHPKYLDSLADSFAEPDGDALDAAIGGLYAKLFKNGKYYSGCGGCYALKVVEVEFGQPMVGRLH